VLYSGGDGPPPGVGGIAPGRDAQAHQGRGAVLWCQSIKWLGHVSRSGGDVRMGTLERGGPRPRGRQPSSDAELARGGVSPRARRTSPEGVFSPAALAGRGGHQSYDRVVCAIWLVD
jgi:hypothetical protein